MSNMQVSERDVKDSQKVQHWFVYYTCCTCMCTVSFMFTKPLVEFIAMNELLFG